MKTKFALLLSAVVTTLVLASCGAGRTASCDAYGSVETQQNNDLASK